ncbi:prepilin-type N-terminal cleavage/methylation domain-containing protein [Neobacillus drentensis]|uniref:PulJ/GspJ family protein n=1 Tax=Neobacillus drentensis TaxID=220684 RepID=UPI003000CC97
MRSERGITLIEVLAAITILSIAGVTIWQVFFQGYQLSQRSVTKNMLQQESNIVISKLTNIHQTEEEYKIESVDCKIKVLSKTNTEIEVFSNSQYCFQAEDPKTKLEIPLTNLKPNETGSDFDLVIRISDRKNIKNTVGVRTLLYRLKEGEKYE